MTIVKPRVGTLSIWRIILTICAIIPALAISFFLSGAIYTAATALWFILYLGAFLVYLPALYNSLIYIADENSVTLRRGVFYSSIYSIPISAIQFTTLTISPFSRLFGLVTLQVVSAGANVSMPGMTLKEARLFEKVIASLKDGDNKDGDNNVQ